MTGHGYIPLAAQAPIPSLDNASRYRRRLMGEQGIIPYVRRTSIMEYSNIIVNQTLAHPQVPAY